MKSIMEKASTVEKAIKKAWDRSGYPLSFSIKILEIPETNFLGLTKTPAKIAFFYSEQSNSKENKTKSSSRKKEPSKPTPSPTNPPQEKKRKTPSRKTSSEWTASMVNSATLWLNTVLAGLNKKDMTFRVLRKNSHLVFQFDRPFIEDNEQQKILFSSFALLLLKALRIKFKEQVKYLKVVFQQKV